LPKKEQRKEELYPCPFTPFLLCWRRRRIIMSQVEEGKEASRFRSQYLTIIMLHFLKISCSYCCCSSLSSP
jgi:hypothetical protein